MIKKIIWIRIITLIVVPFIVFISLFLYTLTKVNLDKMTPENDTYEVVDDTPLLIEVPNGFTATNDRYKASIINKENNQFTLLYTLDNTIICTIDVLIDGGNVMMEYEEENASQGTLNHDGNKPIQFQFSPSVCELNEFGIYIERKVQFEDITVGWVLALIVFVIVILINIKVRQKLIKSLDVEQFHNTKLTLLQKLLFIFIGFSNPLIALLIFLILGTDTKNYKNIKSAELTFMTSLITSVFMFVTIIIMVEFLK